MMMLHFIAGLPRSGSTLLAAILRQNPAVHAGMSSPLAILFDRLITGMGAHNEYGVAIDDVTRINVLQGLFTSFYYDRKGGFDRERVLFDTNRYWCSRAAALAELEPRARIICCVRDLAWVLDSFEWLVQRNPLMVSRLFKPGEGNTVHRRVGALMVPDGPVGFAWHAFQEAYYGPHRDKLIIIDYEHLATNPDQVIKDLYRALDLAPFAHDFEHVEYDGGIYDLQLGLIGLHRVSGPVRYIRRNTILPPDLFDRYRGNLFWRKPREDRI